MISTREAAKRLNISTRRVTKLLTEGKLEGKKISGSWVIDEDSVAHRANSKTKKCGRPKAGSGATEIKFVLYNKTYPTLRLVYNTQLRAFTHVGDVLDKNRLPVGIQDKKGRISTGVFNSWWSGRGIPHTRRNLDVLLEDAGVFVPEELIYRNLGLSLSDQFWIQPLASNLKWEDINFFENDFENTSLVEAPSLNQKTHQAVTSGVTEVDSDATVEAAFNFPPGNSMGAAAGAAHPNNTSDGNLEKFWAIERGRRKLYKLGSGLGQEPYNEVVATNLHKRLLKRGEYVKYALKTKGNSIYSVCSNFLNNNEEFIPAIWVSNMYFQKTHESTYSHYVNCCKLLGAAEKDVKDHLSKMIVCDAILSNTDRHFRNFGIIRNVDTLECKPAPIFDSGNCLWFGVSDYDLEHRDLHYKSKQFYESSGKQLLLIDDFSFVSANKLEGFAHEAIAILTGNPLLEGRLELYEKYLTEAISKMLAIAQFS